MKTYIFTSLIMIVLTTAAGAQQVLPLYPDKIPNSIPGKDEERTEIKEDGVVVIHQISKPTISVFLPSKRRANGRAVIILPGGGYWVNAIKHEGTDVAKEFNKMGVAAFVVKYRIPEAATMPNPEIGPLQDAQQAIKMVRDNAVKWGVKSDQVGVMGFSAGGHLAASAGTHFDKALIDNTSGTSLRPDFMILIYPVISFLPGIGHQGSAEKLLGPKAAKEKIEAWSNELLVRPDTPPSFLVHASDDGAVSPLNSLLFYEALLKNKVPAELHIYKDGGHGFGMFRKNSKELWMESCRNWMGGGFPISD